MVWGEGFDGGGRVRGGGGVGSRGRIFWIIVKIKKK